MAYKSSWGTISSIKNVFLVKLMEINCHLLWWSHFCIRKKSCLCIVLLKMIVVTLSTHINLVMVNYLLFIAHVWGDWNVWWHCFSWKQTIVLCGDNFFKYHCLKQVIRRGNNGFTVVTYCLFWLFDTYKILDECCSS